MVTLSWQVEREAEVETKVEPEFELIWLTVFVQEENEREHRPRHDNLQKVKPSKEKREENLRGYKILRGEENFKEIAKACVELGAEEGA